MILVDTGPLVAIANREDRRRDECQAALASASAPRLVPGMVLAEASYLIAREKGHRVEAQFLRSFGDGFLEPVDASTADLLRAAELVEEYDDLRIGGTDACVVALAERLGISEIATLDRRHFSVVRPRHVEAFRLLPD